LQTTQTRDNKCVNFQLCAAAATQFVVVALVAAVSAGMQHNTQDKTTKQNNKNKTTKTASDVPMRQYQCQWPCPSSAARTPALA
jgi:hypothetical protein